MFYFVIKYTVWSHLQCARLTPMQPSTVRSIITYAFIYGTFKYTICSHLTARSIIPYAIIYSAINYTICKHLKRAKLYHMQSSTARSIIPYAAIYGMFKYTICSHLQYAQLYHIMKLSTARSNIQLQFIVKALKKKCRLTTILSNV